jgi:hypothetical protein
MLDRVKGIMITNVHTGFNASVRFEGGEQSPYEFASTPSEAVAKALRLHAPSLPPPPY